jgi:hypothetical protein
VSLPELEPTISPQVWTAVRRAGDGLREAGAEAIVLVGSHARGTATTESDIDLLVLGDGPEYQLERLNGFLVSTSWKSVEQVRDAFRDPFEAAGSVPAWRVALLVDDPAERAAGLREEARNWSWDVVGESVCDAAVAEQLYGYAEEVHKLVNNLERGRPRVAAVQRSVIALRMARIVALHERLLYETEDDLWDLLSRQLGHEWERAQAAALSEGGEPIAESCRAALELFALAIRHTRRVFSARQLEVAAFACQLAGFPLDQMN